MKSRKPAGFTLLCLTTLVAGCGLPGPWSPKNAATNYPPRVRGVSWVVPASVVVVTYQPRDATDVTVEGWAIYANADFNQPSVPRIHLTYEVRGSLDTINGRGYFLLGEEDWSGWSGSRPLLATLDHYLLITVYDPDGERVGAELWKLSNGNVTHVRSAAP